MLFKKVKVQLDNNNFDFKKSFNMFQIINKSENRKSHIHDNVIIILHILYAGKF